MNSVFLYACVYVSDFFVRMCVSVYVPVDYVCACMAVCAWTLERLLPERRPNAGGAVQGSSFFVNEDHMMRSAIWSTLSGRPSF